MYWNIYSLKDLLFTSHMSRHNFMDLLNWGYIPSELERRRAVLYYLLVGILTSSRKSRSEYEEWHFRQAIGWWLVFVLIWIFSVPLSLLLALGVGFIAWFVGFVLVVGWLVLGVYLVKNALDGKIVIDKKSKKVVLFPFLKWLWDWVVEVLNSDEEWG